MKYFGRNSCSESLLRTKPHFDCFCDDRIVGSAVPWCLVLFPCSWWKKWIMKWGCGSCSLSQEPADFRLVASLNSWVRHTHTHARGRAHTDSSHCGPFTVQEVTGRRSSALRRWERTLGFLGVTRGSWTLWPVLEFVRWTLSRDWSNPCFSWNLTSSGVSSNVKMPFMSFVSSAVLTVWICHLTRALNSWRRSCCLPSRKRKDSVKSKRKRPLLFTSFLLVAVHSAK